MTCDLPTMLTFLPGLTKNSKFCSKCREEKSVEQFAIRGRRTLRPSSYCKPCQREYSKAHYKRSADTKGKRRRSSASGRARILQNAERVRSFLRAHPCVDCGEADICVLEFDHVRGVKVANISYLIGRGFSWERIQREIAKCEIRCANCHRRRTYCQLWQESKIRRVVAQPGRAPRLGRGSRRFKSCPPDSNLVVRASNCAPVAQQDRAAAF